MAVGVGAGFDLSKFTDALKKADTALTNLFDKQNQLSRVTMNAFKQMSEQGVVPYVESLKKQVKLFDSVKVSITDASGKAIRGFGGMKTNIVNATNELNKLINALEKTKHFRGETSGKTAISYANKVLGSRGDKSIDNMRKALQQLEAAQNRQNLRTKTGQKNYENLAESIRRVKNELDKATGSSEKMNKSVSKIGKSHKSLLDISGQLQRRLALVFSVSQITGYINKIVKVRGEFELQQRALQAIVQNVDEANKLWDKTVALAVKSPFRVKELVTYTKQLAAYRIETSKLYDTTKRLADVSAGLGVDMQRLILAYGQVRAANFLRGTELRQFTEAGIPMLEELAGYFSELEGRAISVSEVFERISKRMVTFQDVSAVFQRMTSEGGVFFDMQAKQSETLKGQISNLHDAIDLMMNDIGKSNDSILKSLVSTMRTLVDNWKAFSTAIEEAGVAFAVIHLARFATGLRIAAAGHAALAISMKGSISMGAKFQKMLATLFATIKANPVITLSGAILATLYSLHKYNQSIDEANEKYNELSRSEIRRAKTLNDLNDKVLENNKAIKDNNKTVEEQNDAIKSNNKILSQIKKDYPELYNAVVKQTDGTIDLTEAIKTQNEELRANIALQQQAKGSFWQESQGKNYNDAVEAQKKYAASLEDLNGKAIDLGYQLEYAFDQGKISDESYKRLKEYLKLISNTNDITKLAKREELLITTPYGSHKSYTTSQNTLFENLIGNEEDRELVTKFYYSIEQAVDNAASANAKYTSSLKNLWDTFINQMPTYSTELNKITNAEDRGKWLKEQLTNLNFIDEKLQEWARERLVKELELEIIFSKEDGRNNDKLDDWAIRVKSAIEEVNEKIKNENKDIPENWLFPIPEVGQTKEQYLNSVKPALEAAKAIYREGQKIEDESAIEKTNALKPYADIIERILNIQEKGANKDNEALQRLKEQIRLVRELAKDYQKLWDEQGKDVADASIWSKERIAAFQKAGLDYAKFEVGSEGDEVKNLEKLTDISGELYKAIADARTELGGFKQQLKDAEFARYLDELFGNYEISLELEKLNIPSDLAKKLFGVESIDLNSIRKEILNKAGLGDMQGMTNEAIFSSERYLKLNKEQRKIVEDGLKKEDELQQKALNERLKKYSKYLTTAMGERVKIKMEELRQIEEIENTSQLSSDQKELAKQGVKKESQAKIDKLSWEEFKDSGMYVQLFEDLEYASTRSLTVMREKLEQLKGSLKDLDADDLRNLYNQIEKIDEQLAKRNPFKTFATSIGDYINAVKNTKKLEKDLQIKQTAYDVTKGQEENLDIQLAKLRAEYEAKAKSKKLTDEESNTYLKNIEHLENQLRLLREFLGLRKKDVKTAQENLDNNEKTKKTFKESAKEVGDYISQAANALPQLASDMENIFGTMDAGTRDTIESIAEIGSGIGQAVQGFASGDIVSGIMGVSQAISGIFKVGDKKKEREIQRQIELVEKLGKQYEKLEKQIEKAYTTVDLKSSFDQAQDNLDQQIESRKEMIAQEEAKKKTDKDRIKEWQNEIEELQEQQKELLQSTVEELGGTYDFKSATREFVDAWIDAFRETGNGLKGLEDNFDDFWKNIMLNQAVMGGASQIIEPLLKEINKALENDFKVDDGEWSKIENEKDTAFQRLNDFMQGWFNQWGDTFSDDSGELSGLQRGIQGITEDQADVLASYLNSIRFYVSDNNSILTNLASSINTGGAFNPIVDQLKSILDQTTAINKLLDSVATNGGATAFNVRLLSE